MKDWNEPRDKAPQIEEREQRWQKRSAKKPFAIECRYIGTTNLKLFGWCRYIREWHIYKRYKTESQRTDALENLIRKKRNSVTCNWEYRAYEPDIKRQ